MKQISQIQLTESEFGFQASFVDGTSKLYKELIAVDFDGESKASYKNAQLDLSLTDFKVKATVNAAAQTTILGKLNAEAAEGVLYIDAAQAAALPKNTYSTIYVGDTDAFANLGTFAGLAETTGAFAAAVKGDNAFVFSQAGCNTDALADTIAHEAGHLTGTIAHDFSNDGLTLDDFAENRMVINAGDTNAVSNATFNGLYTNDNGGAIKNNGTVTITASTFTNNTGIDGSAVYTANGATTSIADSYFSGNSHPEALQYGSIATKGTLYISGSTIENSPSGAAIFVGENGVATIDNCLIQNNKDDSYFCGLYVRMHNTTASLEGGTATVTNSVFKGNTISSNEAYGGAAIHNSGKTYVSGCTFTQNATLGGFDKGGAIVNHTVDGYGYLEISDCVFDGNISTGGGAIRNSGGTMVIYGNITLKTNSDTIVNETGGEYQGDDASMIIGKEGYNTFISGSTVSNASNSMSIVGRDVTIDNFTSVKDVSLQAEKIVIGNSFESTSRVIWDFSESTNQSITVDNYENFSANNRYLDVTNTTASSFVVATGATNSHAGESFTLHQGSSDTEIKVGGEVIGVYTLDQIDDRLVLTKINNIAFSNKYYDLAAGQASAVYNTRNYTMGTVGDGLYFNSFSDARNANKSLFIAVGDQAVTGSVALNGETMTLSADDRGGVYGGVVLGGYRKTATDAFTTDTHLTIDCGTFSKAVCGGSYIQGEGQTLTQTGDCNLAINGGIFNGAVAGGMYIYKNGTEAEYGSVALTGNCNLTINGGTFNRRIYGGNYAYDDTVTNTQSAITGNISITIDTTINSVTINDGLDIGSRGMGTVGGNAKITFTGDGNKLSFGSDNRVNGASNMACIKNWTLETWISGDRCISFNGFKGDFDGDITLFKTMELRVANVNLTDTDIDLSDIEDWYFQDNSSSLSSTTEFDFTGDTLHLAYTTPQTLFAGTFSASDKGGWFNEIQANGLTYELGNFNSTAAVYELAGHQSLALNINDGKMTLGTLA